jgi:hypothetical protein
MAPESAGIHRNPQEWHRNPLEWHHSCRNPQEFTKIDFGDKSLIKTHSNVKTLIFEHIKFQCIQ